MIDIADPWRELREDVRALAPPISPEFERRLGEQLAARRTPPRRLGRLRSPLVGVGSTRRFSAAAALATVGCTHRCRCHCQPLEHWNQTGRGDATASGHR